MDLVNFKISSILSLPYLEIHEIALLLSEIKEVLVVPMDDTNKKIIQREFLLLHPDVVGLHKNKDKKFKLLKKLFFTGIENPPRDYLVKPNHLIDAYLDYYRMIRKPLQSSGDVREFLEIDDLWFVSPKLFSPLYMLSGGILPTEFQNFFGVEQSPKHEKEPKHNKIAIDAVGAILQDDIQPSTRSQIIKHELMEKIAPNCGKDSNSTINKRLKNMCPNLTVPIEFSYIWDDLRKIRFDKLSWVMKALSLSIIYYPGKELDSSSTEIKISKIQEHPTVDRLLSQLQNNTKELAKTVIKLVAQADKTFRYLDDRRNFSEKSFQKASIC